MKLNEEQREKCVQAADALMAAFVWDASSEGGEYWNVVHDALLEYAREPAADDEKDTEGESIDDRLVDLESVLGGQVLANRRLQEQLGLLEAQVEGLRLAIDRLSNPIPAASKRKATRKSR